MNLARNTQPEQVLKILVVDDSPAVLAVLFRYLQAAGHEVAAAATFADVPGVLTRFAPDVILLDLKMPGVDGVEFARFVRRFFKPAPPILLHSSAGPEELSKAADAVRPFSIVPKGTCLADILRSIELTASLAATVQEDETWKAPTDGAPTEEPRADETGVRRRRAEASTYPEPHERDRAAAEGEGHRQS